MATKIEYVDLTLNPFVGCSKCSPGCANCYAEKFAARLAKNPNPVISAKYYGVVDNKGNWTGQLGSVDWSCFQKLPKEPCRVFVGSMTDIFKNIIPPDIRLVAYLPRLFEELEKRPDYTFMLLTKRPENMRDWFKLYGKKLPNVWLGVTVCNQEEADKKIPALLDTPAAIRFISVEPMLGSVNIKKYLCGENKLDWVICGGETGAKARPMSEKWVKSLLTQCLEMGTSFFFKSWGEWTPYRSGEIQREVICKNIDDCMMAKVGKRESDHLIDGVEYRRFPEG